MIYAILTVLSYVGLLYGIVAVFWAALDDGADYREDD